MTDSQIIELVNDIRRKLKMYYYWQVLWASVFLLLVFASSLFFGLRTSRFWVYIIIPLLVIGGFWVFLQTTRENVKVRLNQRVMEKLLPHYFEDYRFLKYYNIRKQDFLPSGLISGIHSISARNAILMEIDEVPVIFCYLKIDRNTDRGIITTHAGMYIRAEFGKNLPGFGIYPAHEDIKAIVERLGLTRIKSKLNGDFQVWASDLQAAEVIEKIGPDVLKFSHLCTRPDKFYLSTFGGKLHIGLFNFRDVMEFPLFRPITSDDINKELERFSSCIKFVEGLVQQMTSLFDAE